MFEQDFNGYELYAVGDGCPDFQKIINSGWFDENRPKADGNTVHYLNLQPHTGGYGYQIRNFVKNVAEGEFVMFLDNDDVFRQGHLHNYLSEIVGTDYDFAYFNSYVEPLEYTRNAELRHGCIGHSEIVVRTSFLRRMPPWDDKYGHDWELVYQMIKHGAKCIKSRHVATYVVKSIPDVRESNID